MIQRIQTLFIFLVLIASAAFFIFPIGSVVLNDLGDSIPVKLWGFEYVNQSTMQNDFFCGWYMPIYFGLISLVSLITILLFKRRTLQVRLSVFNIILQFFSIGILILFLYFCKKQCGISFKTTILIVVPLAQIILTVLAIRHILIDDALIKSIDRLR